MSPPLIRTGATTHSLTPRNDTISVTPLVIVPMLCAAIFALILYYTCKREREYADAVATGRRSPRSQSSWDSTGTWVREVRRETGKNPNKKTRRSGGRRARELRDQRGEKTAWAPKSATTTTTGGSTRSTKSSIVDQVQSTHLWTIDELSEPEMTETWRSRSRERRASPSKSPLKGGRRLSSTIRPL